MSLLERQRWRVPRRLLKIVEENSRALTFKTRGRGSQPNTQALNPSLGHPPCFYTVEICRSDGSPDNSHVNKTKTYRSWLPVQPFSPSYFLRLPRERTEGQRAKMEVERPPRGVNSPRTRHHSGRMEATRSRRILLTAFS